MNLLSICLLIGPLLFSTSFNVFGDVISGLSSAEKILVDDSNLEASEDKTTQLDIIISNNSNVNGNSVSANASNPTNSSVIHRPLKYTNCTVFMGHPTVQLINDTELMQLLVPNTNVTLKEAPATCILVLFYSKNCPFSSMAAPYFNALPRAYPQVQMVAINAIAFPLLNRQSGIVGVPSIILFHNGRPVAKFNGSEYSLELFIRFLLTTTGFEPIEKSFVSSVDFNGPVIASPHYETDAYLILSWLFILICASYFFTKTTLWSWTVDTVKRNWRESEAQHVHSE